MGHDHAFRQGKSHQACQDYARSGKGTGPYSISYAILSDGCSGSADTDIGARLLVLSAEWFLKDMNGLPPTGIAIGCASKAAGVASLMGLSDSCVDATLLFVAASGSEGMAFINGDGMAVAGMQDGTLVCRSVSYPSGYPAYPRYLLSGCEDVVEQVGHARVRNFSLLPDGRVIDDETSIVPQPSKGFSWVFDKPRFVAVLSDGIESFQRVDETETSRSFCGMPPEAVLPVVLGFPALQDGFVRRRFQRMQKQFEKLGWTHDDDLSVAAVSL